MPRKHFSEVAEDARDWCVDHWWIVLIGLIVLVGATSAGWRQYQQMEKEKVRQAQEAAEATHAEEAQALAARLSALKPWPMLPEPTLPPLGTRPVTPIIAGNKDLTLRLKQLVETHPSPEVRVDFNRRVESGELLLNFQSQGWEFAAFSVQIKTNIVSQQRADNRLLLPMFTINPDRLAELSTPEQILEAWLVLFHENVHYEQWLAAPPAEQRYSISQKFKPNDELPPGLCDYHWKVERDAYEKECHLALQWGMPDVWENGICRRVDDSAAFNQALFLWMEKGSPMRSCVPNWAAAAGHPHPEAFATPR